MELLIRAAGIAVIGALLGLVLKKNVPELGFAVTLTAAMFVLLLAAGSVDGIASVLERARTASGLSAAVVAPVMKCVGIGIVTRFAADLCSDAGQSAASSAVELCGTVCALTAALPLVESFFALIEDML